MYMNTQANLDYWSTDNCCVYLSLKRGTILIGVLSVIWQSVVTAVAVLALVECHLTAPNVTMDASTNNLFNETSINMTLLREIPFNETFSEATAEEKLLQIGNLLEETKKTEVPMDVEGETSENETSANANCSINAQASPNETKETEETEIKPNATCKWIPEPETESFNVYDEAMLYVVVGVILSFSIIYCLLSLCVIIGVLKEAPKLLHGWVACTALYMILTIADLLITLPFTTLIHLLCCIAQFVVSLYAWAVVKSYMHSLKVAKMIPPTTEEKHPDYTVDGVDIQQQVPVEV